MTRIIGARSRKLLNKEKKSALSGRSIAFNNNPIYGRYILLFIRSHYSLWSLFDHTLTIDAILNNIHSFLKIAFVEWRKLKKKICCLSLTYLSLSVLALGF